jgi:P4 family phage/plasmid primase-like protien
MTTTSSNETLKEGALRYAGRGIPIFPLQPRSKKPFSDYHVSCASIPAWAGGPHPTCRKQRHGGFYAATTDPARIAAWWDLHPEANIGGATGVVFDGFDIDVDPDKGTNGEDTFTELEAKNGQQDLGPVHTTGRGGRHILLQPTGAGSSNGAIGEGLDFKGKGGYILLPPSVHPNGNPYEAVVAFDDAPLPAAAEWLKLAAIQSSSLVKSFDGVTAEDVPVGRRHDYLASRAGVLRALRFNEASIYAALSTENALFDEPVPDKDIEDFARNYAAKVPGTIVYDPGDKGNADWFADYASDRACYDHLVGQWRIWNDQRWADDPTEEINRLWDEAYRARLHRAADLTGDQHKNELMAAASMTHKSRRDAGLSWARANAAFARDGTEFDRDPYLIGADNGVVELEPGRWTFRAGRQSDNVTKTVGYGFDAGGSCPTLDRTLDDIFMGDRELIDAWWVYFGYSLTGDVSARKVFFCWGIGSNGKSVLARIMRAVAGDYGATAEPSLVESVRRGFGRATNDVRELKDVRLAIAPEWDETAVLDEGRMKRLTGGQGEQVKGRLLYQNNVAFNPTHKLWLLTNHKPAVVDDSLATWDRIILIPFLNRFTPTKAGFDPYLGDKIIAAELSGILRRALDGAVRFLDSRTLPRPAAVLNATADYRAESDLIANWLDAGNAAEIAGCRTPYRNIADSFRAWYRKEGYAVSELPTDRKLAALLIGHGFKKVRVNGGVNYDGIRIDSFLYDLGSVGSEPAEELSQDEVAVAYP